jgi:hypothetical protein
MFDASGHLKLLGASKMQNRPVYKHRKNRQPLYCETLSGSAKDAERDATFD